MKLKFFAVFAAMAAAVFVFSACATNRITPEQESISHFKMGLSRMESGNNESAMYEFNQAIRFDDNNKDAHFAAGVIHYRQNDLAGAEREFKKVLSLDPHYVDANNALGSVYAGKKEYEKAIKEFKTAAESPYYKSQDTAYVNMGIAYDAMGDQEKAAQSFREALLIQPDNNLAMLSLASEYFKMDKLDEAIKYYNKAIDLYPDNLSANYQLGIVYFKLGRNKEAAESFRKAKNLAAPGSNAAVSIDKYLELLK